MHQAPNVPKKYPKIRFQREISRSIRKVNMNKKNNQTTIIDVKFDEQSKSELRIRLQDKEKPENAEVC